MNAPLIAAVATSLLLSGVLPFFTPQVQAAQSVANPPNLTTLPPFKPYHTMISRWMENTSLHLKKEPQ